MSGRDRHLPFYAAHHRDPMSTRVPRPGGFSGDATSDWMIEGACRNRRDVEFFPTDGSGVQAARRVCAGCTVRAECLEFALAEGINHGVWGGTSDRERQRIRATRAKEARTAARSAAGAGRGAAARASERRTALAAAAQISEAPAGVR
jgi:WhiB family redox-sensing transcriptional regulator